MRRVAARRAAAAAALLLAGVAGCGGTEASPLQETSDNLADVRSADLDLSLRLVPSGSDGVGVSLRGPFALSADTPLPVADIDYVQTAGKRVRATFTSTGRKAYVTTAGRTVRLAGKQLTGLRVGAGDTKRLSDLGLDVQGWIEGAKTAAGPRIGGAATERITGRLRASKALGDLARASGQTGLTEDEVKRLSRTVSASSIEILTGKDDRLLRRLRLSVALDVPPELRPKTGGTTALEVKVDLALRRVNRPVRVSAPGGA